MLGEILGIIFVVAWALAAVAVVHYKPEYDKIRKDIKEKTGYKV